MARRVAALAIAAAATLGISAAAPVSALTIGPTDWPGYMFAPSHSSDNSADTAFTTSNAPSTTQTWRQPISFLSSPVVADGYVFIGSTNGTFYELDAATGAIVSSIFLGTQPGIACPARGFVSTASVAFDSSTSQDMVYVSDPSGYLDALTIPGLTVAWRSVIAIPSTTSNNYFDWSSPTVANGKVYVGISSNCDQPLIRGGVAAYDQVTGSQIATFYTVPKGAVGGSVWTSVAVDDSGYVYAATGNASRLNPHYGVSIVKLDGTTLAPVAQFTVPLAQRTTDNDFGGSPTIFGSLVGACNHNGIYYAVNRATMSEAWHRRIGVHVGGPVQAQCAAGGVYDGSHLFIAGDATTIGGKAYPGSIRMLNPSNGNFVWQTGLPDGVIGAPTINGSGVLAVATYDMQSTPNAVYLINAANGQILNVLNKNRLDFAQPVFADGHLYAANLTAIGEYTP